MSSTVSFQQFMQSQIKSEREYGRIRMAEIHTTTLNSFNRFLEGRELPFKEMTPALLERYEHWLAYRHVRRNTSSFYMRILRAVYNRAVDKGLARQRHPFKHVYTGVSETVKRALPPPVIRKLARMDLGGDPHLSLARDLFLFSFYTRGMSFVDMAFLRPENIRDGRLVYARRKTGKTLSILWEPCMQAIVDRYPENPAGYLLPVITRASMDGKVLYRQYKTRIYAVNRALKTISEILRLERPFTTYSARHSWASIAYHKSVPVSVISEGMGHHSEKMTRIYLSSLDNAEIDKANRTVLRGFL